MNTITAILEADPDGSLHVPLPEELRHRRVRIAATIEAAEDFPPMASVKMLRQRGDALAALRALGGLRQVIADPVAWQRDLREDRPLPGRK